MSVATRPARTPSTAKRAKSPWKRRFKVFLSLFFLILGIVFLVGSFEAFRRLQEAKLLVPKLDEVFLQMSSTPSEIVSADGVTLFTIQNEYRRPIKRIDMPQKVVDAVLAAEDKRFYEHVGVDIIALGRIASVALRSGEPSQGASTLTMQIAKQVYNTPRKTLDRKLSDMALAIEIEKHYAKDQILELYMNHSFFGAGAYGIVAAADVYFGKSLEDLTIAECAMLARCVRRPSDENPFNDLEGSIRNRNVVLKIMRDEGMIDEAEYRVAVKEEVKLRTSKPEVITAQKKAPYFVDYVLKQLRDKNIDISRGGYKVYTTLNFELQKIAVEEANKALKKYGRYNVNRISFLSTDGRGRILVMVPDTDYSKRQFNMQDSAPGRQPGSSFKPFVYAAGIERGAFGSRDYISRATYVYSMPDASGRRRPVRGGAGSGSISIASALSSSNNTVAVRAISMVGPENMAAMGRSVFGFERSNLPAVEPLALGAGEVLMTEMAGAYSVFQTGGDRVKPYGIERIERPDGTLIQMQPPVAKRVLSSTTAQAIDEALRRAATQGTGKAASVVKNVRGKTGTTTANKDAWFCGYTDKLIAICWISRIEEEDGRPVSKPMSSYIQGGTGAAPVWADIMKKIQAKVGEEGRSFDFQYGGGGRVVDEPDDEVEPEDLPVEEPTEPENGGAVVPPPLPDEPGYTAGGGGSVPPVVEDAPPPARGTSSSGNEDVVYVRICADSGQRSTVYCPEAPSRPFVKGTEPRGRCPIHG